MKENDFENIAKIYMEGWGGQLYNPPPNKGYPAKMSKHSYRGTLPFNSGGDDNNYTSNMMNSSIVPVSDEEELNETQISNIQVVQAIDEIIDQANKDGMDYCVFMLGKLKGKISAMGTH